jgi:hypothetical protein
MENTIYFAHDSNFCIGKLINSDTYHIKEYSFWAFQFVSINATENADCLDTLFDNLPCVEYDANINTDRMLHIIISNKRYITCMAEMRSIEYQLRGSFEWRQSFPKRYYYMDNGCFCYASMSYGDGSFIIRQYDVETVYKEFVNIAMHCEIARLNNSQYIGERFSTRVSQLRATSKTYADPDGYRAMLKRLAYNECITDEGDIEIATKAACDMISAYWLQAESQIKNAMS